MKHSFVRRCAVGALAVGTLLTTGCGAKQENFALGHPFL